MEREEPTKRPMNDSDCRRKEPKKIPLLPIDKNKFDILDAVAQNILENFGNNEDNQQSD